MDNWDAIKEKYEILFQKYLDKGFSRAAADELAILEARRFENGWWVMENGR